MLCVVVVPSELCFTSTIGIDKRSIVSSQKSRRVRSEKNRAYAVNVYANFTGHFKNRHALDSSRNDNNNNSTVGKPERRDNKISGGVRRFIVFIAGALKL